MLWEFLALQCPHGAGWRKVREGKFACKVCGTLRGANERWLLLPRAGRKVIGCGVAPASEETFPNGAFVAELLKRALKRFPLLVEFDRGGELVGITIFRPIKEWRRARPKAK